MKFLWVIPDVDFKNAEVIRGGPGEGTNAGQPLEIFGQCITPPTLEWIQSAHNTNQILSTIFYVKS